MQATVVAATQGIHHHQRGTATVLALVPLLAPRLAPATFPPRPAPMTLAAAGTAALVARSGATSSRQFLFGRRGRRLAIDLDDQHLALAHGHGAVAEVDVGGPGQAQDPLLDGRARRRGPQE